MHVRRGVLRLSAVVGSVALAVVLPVAAQAPFVQRVRWPLADVIVRGDTAGRFEVIASPNLSSTQGTAGATRLNRLRPSAEDALQWATLMRRLVDSVAELPRNIVPILLQPQLHALGSEDAMHLGAAMEAGQPRFRFLVTDDEPERGWQVAITAREVRALLDAMSAVAGAVLMPERRTPQLEQSGTEAVCPIPDSVSVTEDDVAERTRMRSAKMSYPAVAYPRSGRVWLQFVINTAGVVEAGSHCVLLSDHEWFTAAVLRALPKFRFDPGMRDGVPVAVCVFQEYRFRVRP